MWTRVLGQRILHIQDSPQGSAVDGGRASPVGPAQSPDRNDDQQTDHRRCDEMPGVGTCFEQPELLVGHSSAPRIIAAPMKGPITIG